MRIKIIKKIFLLTIIITIIAVASISLSACKAFGDTAGLLETFEVTRGDIIQTVSASGYVDSAASHSYFLPASGKVTFTLDEGDLFGKGDLLFEVDSSRQALLVAQAEENINISREALELARINYQQALDANHIAVQLAGLNEDLAEQATQSAYSSLGSANELANDSVKSASTALENTRSVSSLLIESARVAWVGAKEVLTALGVAGNPTAQANANNALANYETVKAQQQANIDSAEGTYETTKEQNQSSVNSAQSAYEQSLLNQSSTSWTNLSSTQSAEAQIAITAKNISQAETQLRLSEISLELVKLDTDNSVIYAPYDGIVLSSGYSLGEYASPGMAAISVVSSDFVIKAEVNETDIASLKTGQEAVIRLDAYYDSEFYGKITRISPISGNIGGVVSFEITVEPEKENSPELLYGMSASLDITTSGAKNVLYVPIQYIYEEDSRTYVDLLNEDGTTERKEVTTGAFSYDYIEIKSGLAEGDTVSVSSV